MSEGDATVVILAAMLFLSLLAQVAMRPLWDRNRKSGAWAVLELEATQRLAERRGKVNGDHS